MGELTDIVFMHFIFWCLEPRDEDLFNYQENNLYSKLSSSALLYEIYATKTGITGYSLLNKYDAIAKEMWKCH